MTRYRGNGTTARVLISDGRGSDLLVRDAVTRTEITRFDLAPNALLVEPDGARAYAGLRGEALLHGSTTDRSGVKVADDHAVTAEDCAVPSANILFSTVHPTLASRCCASNPFARRLPPRIRLYRRNVPSTLACCR